jgi:hypothetical protein
MTTPGEFPASALVAVSHGERLIPGAANALKALIDAAKHHGLTITLASPGAAYRDAQTQNEMRRGSMGDVALARKWDLNPNSSVPVAAHPYGTHEHGDRVDLLFDGSSNPSTSQVGLAASLGWRREFGAADPNHFQWDGRTNAHYGIRAYTRVVSGDTLSGIAARHGLTLAHIESLNRQIHNPNLISIGEQVWLS